MQFGENEAGCHYLISPQWFSPGGHLMELKRIDFQLLDHLQVGVSILAWYPEDPLQMKWVYVNEARCRMSGFSREEILAKPAIAQVTRETRAMIQKVNQDIAANGYSTGESTLLHRSNRAIPVMLHMRLIRIDEGEALLTEFHDISFFKETESQLKLSRESTREMLSLIEREKKNIAENIQDNLGLVLLPLLDQLRISATDQQLEILDLIVERIGQIGREMGIGPRVGPLGGNLTKRQILICEMIRDGMTSKEIASVLNCSPSTINNHRNIIRKKLKLSGESTNLQAFLNSHVDE
jgi:PAS domain S-box-containing protein